MLRNIRNLRSMSSVTNISKEIITPAQPKLKLTEKWKIYWKGLLRDYTEMVKDVRTDIQNEPEKALLYISGLGTMLYLASTNPNERDFQDALRTHTNELILVNEGSLKQKSIDHIRNLQVYLNEDRLHYQSFGIASIMYISDYNKSCDLYKTQCKYITPTIFSIPQRIVDFGFLGKWWNLFIKTTDYDINDEFIIMT